jgi:hypothetical protein
MKVDTHKSKKDEEKEYQEKLAKAKRTRAMLLGTSLLIVLGLLGYFLSGGRMTGSKERVLTPTEVRLMKVAALYREYNAATQRPPADIDELKNWVKRLDKRRLNFLDVDEVDSLFVSERDQQPFVLDPPPPSIGPILAHEKTGTGGKRFVVSSTGNVTEVDEENFKQMQETMRGLGKRRSRYGGK